jgi:DNA invertase Pin-like site-specific DNA recombinase
VTSSPASLVKVKSGAGAPSSTKSTSRRAVGIVRVSRTGDRDGERFVSPKDQLERIRSACARDELDLVDVLEELDVSGGTALAARPKLSQAIVMVEAGEAQVIVVAFLDRLVRSLAVQRELLERVEAAGGAIMAVDVGEVRADTASRWLSSTMLGMVAEYHRRVTAERTIEAKRGAIARGVAPFPNLPFYLRRDEDDGTIKLDRKGARIAREAVRRRIDGATIKDVQAYLRRNGVDLSFHGAQSFLCSRMLLGELHFGELVNENAFPAVIDAATWQRLQRVFVPRGRRPKSDRLLARLGVLRCATCGGKMSVGSANHGRYAIYRCSPVSDCPDRVTIGAVKAERAVIEAVQERLVGIGGSASIESSVGEAADDLARRQDALDAAIRAFDGLGDEEATRERLRELREARDRARVRHEELLDASAPAIIVSAGDWDLLSLDGRRDLIKAVIGSATVRPGRGADRISIEPRR